MTSVLPRALSGATSGYGSLRKRGFSCTLHETDSHLHGVLAIIMDRLEGLAKLTGRERYLDDEPIDGCLWGMTVRSPAPRGRITAVRFDPALNWVAW